MQLSELETEQARFLYSEHKKQLLTHEKAGISHPLRYTRFFFASCMAATLI